MKRTWLLIATALLLCACAVAQAGGPDSGPVTLPAPAPGLVLPGSNVFFRTQKMGDNMAANVGYVALGEFGKPITGAPYTATAVTETTQVLADGNRIVNKTTALVARDSQGRTRREETMGNIGPLTVKAPRMAFITDPVAKSEYVLDLNDQTARVMPPPLAAGGTAQTKQMLVPPGPMVNVQKKVLLAAGGPEPGVEQRIWISTNEPGQVKTESLGTQVIEGVTAEGKLVTRTIPAGEIGNERPLEITSEVWTSPDLRTVVLSKRNDPRFGETVYRLTNINRAEPDSSLFQIPAGFTVRSPERPN